MKHAIRCKTCQLVQAVNGQKQIDAFVSGHSHSSYDYWTGKYVELDNPQDRISLKIDKPELVTGKPQDTRIEVYRTDIYHKTYAQAAQEFADSFPEPRKAIMTGNLTFKLVDGLAEYAIDSESPKDSFPVYVIYRKA